ncbi:hypothetical protein [Flavobacterium crassostreae]|uniref:DUF4878 domain-containing protein n=1 Tax=Flavobacterium crassostreae TaxID=1763534 RepID=A0A1B9DQ22_9FLAO|nr:hypothetical protein [Flavobacterium crassostreae]OCB71798.1 hypothetical protein LPBF_11440 [Flavobacterium crassostreae]
MKLTKKIFIIIIVLISKTSYSQDLPDEMIKSFFTQYSKNPAKAVEKIYQTSIWTSRLKDGIEDMKNEVGKYTIDYMGEYYGSELITKKQLSNTFVLYSYLLKYDRQPIRFIFKLYRPNDKWVLFSLKIDGVIDEEIEQSAKLFNLDLEK